MDAIILAGGSGTRMNAGMNKVLMPLLGRPMVCYTLDAFEKSDCIDNIILVINEDDADFYSDFRSRYTKLSEIVHGGATRRDSSYIGIQKSTSKYIMIHDAARALISTEDIKKASEAVEDNVAVTLGVACVDTMKMCDADGFVTASVDRSALYKVYTPQAFNRNKLIELHKNISPDLNITDDCSLFEINGLDVKIICGEATNIKLTTPDDIGYAEYILSKRKNN